MVSVTVVACFPSKVHLCVVCCACDFVQNLLLAYFSMNSTIFYYFSKPGSCLCDSLFLSYFYMRISFLCLGAVSCNPFLARWLFSSCVCVSIGEFKALGCVGRVG